MKLYEISNEIEKHLEAYNSVESQESLDAIEQQLDGLQIAFKDKAVNVAHFIMNTDSGVDQIEKEIERLNAKKAHLKSVSESLRGYLKRCMIETGTDKIETPLVRLSFRKSERVDILDESKVPEKYWAEKVTRSISKTAIKEDWKAGVGVDGTAIVEEKNLQIK